MKLPDIYYKENLDLAKIINRLNNRLSADDMDLVFQAIELEHRLSKMEGE